MVQVRVVIPVYRVEKYLKRCVDSVLHQTMENLKLYSVDDGSPDQCPAICDEYAQKDSRIHVIHQNNYGLSSARNAGIDYISRYDYITFIDSDDWVDPRYLEVMWSSLQKTGCEVAICGHKKVFEQTLVEDKLSILQKYARLSNVMA